MNSTEGTADPKTIGRFQLQALLERGPGFALNHALDSESGDRVTLACGLSRLRAEAEWKATRSLRPSGILRALELGHDVGAGAFLVYEPLEGRSVASLIGDGLPAQVGLHLLIQLMHTLEAAGPHGNPHGDLRPENLWLRPSGELAVLGFGAAAAAGAVPTAASDRYDVAVTAFRILTGQWPFPSSEGSGTAAAAPPAAPGFPPDMPAGMQRVFAKALDPQPANRYTSLTGFLSVLIAATPLDEDRLEALLAFMDGVPADLDVSGLLQEVAAAPPKPDQWRDNQPIPVQGPVNGHAPEGRNPVGSASARNTARQPIEALLRDFPGLQEFAIFGHGGGLESASKPCETLGDLAPAYFFDAADALLGPGSSAPATSITLRGQGHGAIVLVRKGALAIALLFKQGKPPKGLLEQLAALPPA